MKKYYKTKENGPKLTTLAFTLIELIAVLVILAILALIVTPIVMNIIRKARISADKRSIDAYGRSIEYAIATYLLDNGAFPTDVSQLTIEYIGDQVECTTAQLNSDSSIYLAGCRVAGRSVDGYTYGSDKTPTYTAYTVGDEVSYNNIDYYVIKDSNASEETVVLLKATPLTTTEVNQYGEGYVNQYYKPYGGYEEFIAKGAEDVNGYGGMVYYTSETCGYENNNLVEYGCTTDYAASEIKYVVDAWKEAKVPSASESRLITYAELNDLGEFIYNETPSGTHKYVQLQYDWLYSDDYFYWTMSTVRDSSSEIWIVDNRGRLSEHGSKIHDCFTSMAHTYVYSVRPVITIQKSALN